MFATVRHYKGISVQIHNVKQKYTSVLFCLHLINILAENQTRRNVTKALQEGNFFSSRWSKHIQKMLQTIVTLSAAKREIDT